MVTPINYWPGMYSTEFALNIKKYTLNNIVVQMEMFTLGHENVP